VLLLQNMETLILYTTRPRAASRLVNIDLTLIYTRTVHLPIFKTPWFQPFWNLLSKLQGVLL
jgi:hypothetical protein